MEGQDVYSREQCEQNYGSKGSIPQVSTTSDWPAKVTSESSILGNPTDSHAFREVKLRNIGSKSGVKLGIVECDDKISDKR